MPLAGFRDLPTLKARLLPADMGEGWEYDADLAEIGMGVVSAFESFTGRVLRRTVGSVFECSAEQASIVLNCYPVESIASIVMVDGFSEVPVPDVIVGKQFKSGMLHFGGAVGSSIQTLRITSTGGYWCQDNETEEAMPAGAFPLPADLLHAWYQQIRAVCEAENIFRTKGAGRPSDKKGAAPISLQTLELLPSVRKTLQLYLRIG